jgi:hypothetical protein
MFVDIRTVMDNAQRLETIAKSPISLESLKWLNTYAGFLHLASGILVLAGVLALGKFSSWSRDLYTFYLHFNVAPGVFSVVPDPQVVFTLAYLGVLLALFPFVSAAAHFTIAFLKNDTYNANLKKGMNPYRWFEYAISSSIMIVLIATFTGVWDLWSLVMIFVLNGLMNMFGYQMEKMNQYTKKVDWSNYVLGCVAGFTPWVVMSAYFVSALNSSQTKPPTFVYLVLAIYFLLFCCFAVNMLLQYKGVGKWKDYLYGERVYILLSFVAKFALTWLVFTGVFTPF